MYFICTFAVCIGIANAAVRDENATNRNSAGTPTSAQNQTVSSRTASTRAVAGRSATARTPSTVTSRIPGTSTITRSAAKRPASTRSAATVSRTAAAERKSASGTTTARTASPVVSRAAIDTVSDVMSSTQIGAEYEQCKSAYFTCMDQFCQLKNDDYRRCSCSNRVFDLSEVRATMQDAGDQLTVFNENLDVVGMTAAQATAMKTASEGENALTSDTSASKQLLQAIMNSIRGDDASVGGKYSDLNSITLSFDTVNAFGMADAGQIIATYNGQNLYNAVYPQCREAVRADCTDAQLQRAITAYLMAIEQDCNTVQSAIDNQQKELKSAIRESSAMLDLARVENRQNHNSSDMAACLTNVENAVLSEEVCGAGYHKCLDNGEFIDVTTGAPISGVKNFYELGNLLKFADGVDAADQKLSKIASNRSFVKNFENRVKKFAEPELDKCTEIADEVWAEYLDKAMLDIYYAQQSKVAEIKQGCFDFVSTCYMNGEAGLTAAMKALTGEDTVILQPDRVALETEMCRDYIDSCNMMFYEQTDGQNIVTDYINNRQDTDTLTACRAVVQQCFDNFGGTRYENFYYPYSGLFKTGEALEWFTLYEYDENGNLNTEEPVSKCAQQLKSITSCNTPEIMEKAFGGFDVITASKGTRNNETVFFWNPDGEYKENGEAGKHRKYGTLAKDTVAVDYVNAEGSTVTKPDARILSHHTPRPTGVATEIYNQIVDILSTQCTNVQGRFIELQFVKIGLYQEDNLCISNFAGSMEYGGGGGQNQNYFEDSPESPNLVMRYDIGMNENMCPREYNLDVDTQSWGACLCWENGGRRSKHGQSPKCIAGFPVKTEANDAACDPETYATDQVLYLWQNSAAPGDTNWCTVTPSSLNQVCPVGSTENDNGICVGGGDMAEELELINLPDAIQ